MPSLYLKYVFYIFFFINVALVSIAFSGIISLKFFPILIILNEDIRSNSSRRSLLRNKVCGYETEQV